MASLQTDIIEIYNALSVFSKQVIESEEPRPINVWFDEEFNSFAFELEGKSVRIRSLSYYCLDLPKLKSKTFLLPEDYDVLMSSLLKLIKSGKLIEDRLCVSPENLGFKVFLANPNIIKGGPRIIGSFKFVSGKSWLFKTLTKFKYGLWD